MELTFMSLDDDCVRFIIEASPNADLRNLRCVNWRLRALVDERVTEIDMKRRFPHIQTDILRSWKGFPNVKTLKIGLLSQEALQILLKTRWPLETLEFGCVYDADDDILDGSHRINPSAFRSVRHLLLTGDGADPGTLAAIVSVCPLLQSLAIMCPLPDHEGLLCSSEILGALAGSGPADAPHLKKLTLPGCSLVQHRLRDFFPVHWDILEELDLTNKIFYPKIGPNGVRDLFGPPSHRLQFPNLKILSLGGLGITMDHLHALFDVQMHNLEVLDLSEWKVGPGVGAVLRRFSQSNLKKLALVGTELDIDEITAFMEVTLPRLESIELEFGEGGALALLDANAHRWPSLRDLGGTIRCVRQEIESFGSNNIWKLRLIELRGPPHRFNFAALMNGIPVADPATPQLHSFRLSK